jgi:hypothetical protein
MTHLRIIRKIREILRLGEELLSSQSNSYPSYLIHVYCENHIKHVVHCVGIVQSSRN